jgi:hypothetical protein
MELLSAGGWALGRGFAREERWQDAVLGERSEQFTPWETGISRLVNP